MVKRLFDILFSSVALLFLCPVLVGIGLWVRLGSDGPVLFRQERVGLGGRIFRIYKFRTMYTDAEKRGPQVTTSNDPRVTRQGHLLRKYKLDELPQFLNVWLGDMSVVGPRPEVQKYMRAYPEQTRDIVLSVRPGITDLASIEFKDENSLLDGSDDPEHTYITKILPIKQSYYIKYAQHHNLWLDLGIICKTIKEVLKSDRP